MAWLSKHSEALSAGMIASGKFFYDMANDALSLKTDLFDVFKEFTLQYNRTVIPRTWGYAIEDALIGAGLYLGMKYVAPKVLAKAMKIYRSKENKQSI